MLSVKLRDLSELTLKNLLEKCKIPSSAEGIKKQFNVSITFSENENGEKFATIDTRLQDNLWWSANKHKTAKNWRESDIFLYSFTGYSDDSERSVFIAALLAIKPVTCMKHLASLNV